MAARNSNFDGIWVKEEFNKVLNANKSQHVIVYKWGENWRVCSMTRLGWPKGNGVVFNDAESLTNYLSTSGYTREK